MSSKYSNKRLMERAIIPPRFDMLNHKGASAPAISAIGSNFHTPFSEFDEGTSAAVVLFYGIKYGLEMYRGPPSLLHPYGRLGGNEYKAYRMYPSFKKLNYF